VREKNEVFVPISSPVSLTYRLFSGNVKEAQAAGKSSAARTLEESRIKDGNFRFAILHQSAIWRVHVERLFSASF
jgi:hypothetical protein